MTETGWQKIKEVKWNESDDEASNEQIQNSKEQET